jgi:hypothetical protein
VDSLEKIGSLISKQFSGTVKIVIFFTLLSRCKDGADAGQASDLKQVMSILYLSVHEGHIESKLLPRFR